MTHKRRDASRQTTHTFQQETQRAGQALQAPSPCDCTLLTAVHDESSSIRAAGPERVEEGGEIAKLVLVERDVKNDLLALLEELSSSVSSMSLLLLHMFQLESVSLSAHAKAPLQRRRCHALHNHFQQVLTNVRRVIRVDDALVFSAHASAVLIFPDVNQQGIATILERVYNSVYLLQAETLVPPLNRETLIQVGVGSYPYPASSIEALLAQVTSMSRSLTLRPVIPTQLNHIEAALTTMSIPAEEIRGAEQPRVPYMDLPHRLAPRLKQLLPYALACELRCVPVGRDNYRLTVAMAEPTHAASIRRLDEATGLSIFPVACDEEALNRLLTQPW